jgi:chemotaxis protein CheC
MSPAYRIREEHFLEAGKKAADSLAAWIGHPVRLDWSRPETVTVEEAGELFGPVDAEVAACVLDVHGSSHGRFVLVVDATSVARFVSAMMGTGPNVPLETIELIQHDPSGFWDELARSAALETANIVACAFLNALARSWTEADDSDHEAELVPSPPHFTLDFAGSLSQLLLADIAERTDGILLTKSRMKLEERDGGDWRLVWIPVGTKRLASLPDADTTSQDGTSSPESTGATGQCL